MGGVNQQGEALIEFVTEKRPPYMQTPEEMSCESASTIRWKNPQSF